MKLTWPLSTTIESRHLKTIDDNWNYEVENRDVKIEIPEFKTVKKKSRKRK